MGEYFSRFGEVMDVVLVTDRLSATLQSCARAQRLQQRRAMVLDASLVQQSGGGACLGAWEGSCWSVHGLPRWATCQQVVQHVGAGTARTCQHSA